MSAAISGFGDGYTVRQNWTSLNDDTIDAFSNVLRGQAELDADTHTRYHTALAGALKSFANAVDVTNSGAPCRILIWFTDGLHDDNNSGSELSSKEISQISSVICGSGGLVDQLRSNGVFIRAVGLNPQPKQLSLMKLIAEGQGTFSLPSSNLSRCGDLPPTGKFTLAANSSEIVDAIISVPGGPTDEVAAGPCAEAVSSCSEIRFTADSTVIGFKVLVSRPPRGVTDARFNLPSGQSIPIFPTAEDGSTPPGIVVEGLTADKALIDVRQADGSELAGDWSIEFSGPAAKDASGRVRFVGETNVVVQDSTGQTLSSVDRYKATGFKVVVGEVGVASRVEAVDIGLEYRQTRERLNSVAEADGSYTVAAEQLKSLLQGSLQSAPVIDLVVQPRGSIGGLVRKDGSNSPIEISYRASRITLRVTNGQRFPEYVPPDQSSQVPRIKGNERTTVAIAFRGPDTADGTVQFEMGEMENADDSKLKFEIVGGQECKIPQKSTTVCYVDVKPSESAYGVKEIPLKFTASTEGITENQADQTIPVKVSMSRKPNAANFWKALIERLLLFFGVQALLRLIFAILISKFPAIDPTTRKARIDVNLDSEGTVSGRGGGRFVIQDGDDNFALENSESQKSFNIFGFEFRADLLRTFLKSTTTPQGYVTKPGHVVIGAGGVTVNRKLDAASFETTGVVALSLPNQWVLSIPREDFASLANGATSTSAELVVFLKPYLQVEKEQQLSDLEFSFASSNLSADVRHIAASFLSLQPKDEQSPSDQPGSPPGSFDPFGDSPSGNPFGDPGSAQLSSGTGSDSWNPFGDFETSSTSAVDESQPLRRRGLRKRSRNSSNEANDIDTTKSPTTDSYDPFA